MDNSQVLATQVSRKLRERLEILAKENDRSLAAEMRVALRYYLEHQDGKKAAA